MSEISIARKPFIVGVMGSHKDEAAVIKQAYLIGEAVAKRGCVLLTGGGPGLMRAASEGACRSGGLVIGILPNERTRPLSGYPNEFVDIPIYTGMSDARNVINAKTPHVLIALNGGVGTLSEIAFALRAGTPVIGFCCPDFVISEDYDFTRVASTEEAIEKLDVILERWGNHPAGCRKEAPVL
jgi:uncharacterized protein (TIGR00725 family)